MQASGLRQYLAGHRRFDKTRPLEHSPHVNIHSHVDVLPTNELVRSTFLMKNTRCHMGLLLANARKVIEALDHFSCCPAVLPDVAGIASVVFNQLACRSSQPPSHLRCEALKCLAFRSTAQCATDLWDWAPGQPSHTEVAEAPLEQVWRFPRLLVRDALVEDHPKEKRVVIPADKGLSWTIVRVARAA